MWKAINYGNITPGLYDVSDNGEIRNAYDHSLVPVFKTAQGHMASNLFSDTAVDGISAQVVARIVYNAFVEVIDRRKDIVYKDGNKANLAVSNLTVKPHRTHTKSIVATSQSEVLNFDSLVEASESLGISKDALKQRLSKKNSRYGKEYHGYTWVYKEDIPS